MSENDKLLVQIQQIDGREGREAATAWATANISDVNRRSFILGLQYPKLRVVPDKAAEPDIFPDAFVPPKRSKIIDGFKLMGLEIAPTKWMVDGVLPEGLSLLAGKPKIGKSWLALGLALAVGAGDMALGMAPTEQGDVLYLALEDNRRRLKSRIAKMTAANAALREGLKHVNFVTDWETHDRGGIERLDEWIAANPATRLVIVDTLQRVRAPVGRNANPYAADYQSLQPYAQMAAKYGIAIVVLHHVRKMEADDPFDLISGTNGLKAAADTLFVLRRRVGSLDATLDLQGRDIEEAKLALLWNVDACAWLMSTEPPGLTAERRAIVAVMGESGLEMTPTQVAKAINASADSVGRTMRRMFDGDFLFKPSYGHYALPGGLYGGVIAAKTDT